MIDLHRFFVNPFDEDSISLDALVRFSTDHLAKMIANNTGGIYTARITATTTAINTVDSVFTDDQTKLGVRKAKKLTKKTFRKTLPAAMSKIAGVVTGKYGKSGPQVAEIFPHGRTIFGRSPDDQLGNYLQATINGLSAHQADLGAQVVTDATALLTNWSAVYSSSETSSGSKNATEQAKNTARQALQLELFHNLLTLALNNSRMPAQLSVYMQQSLLENKGTSALPKPTPHPGTPEPTKPS